MGCVSDQAKARMQTTIHYSTDYHLITTSLLTPLTWPPISPPISRLPPQPLHHHSITVIHYVSLCHPHHPLTCTPPSSISSASLLNLSASLICSRISGSPSNS